ncbi:MAG: carbohydrate ABC transporter permease [Anaerolineae bacterium]|nr:carbohydrate ABC transporter permease [Anaerolineae bacterium]MDW8098047.1 carbohydrate ABC transporter permease [Anaerolineae bacterium]
MITLPKRWALSAAVAAIVKYSILAFAGAWMLLPFFWMFSASLMTPQEITRRPPPLLPASPQWYNYVDVAQVVPLGRAYLNSLLVTTATVAGILFTSSLCGFAFAKYEFPGRQALFLLVLATMMIPFFVTLIPVFYIVKQLGWLNNYAGLIFPGIVSAYGIFLMRQFILDIPDELIDAARIDGASEFRIYWQIILPLAGPALATLGSFNFVGVWNAFLWPLLVVQSRDLFTVPLALNSLRVYGAGAESFNLQMAGTALSVIPALVAFISLQRYFVRGIALTGLKG